MALGDRLLRMVVSEAMNQGSRLASQAINQSIHEGFNAVNNYNTTQRVLANERERNKITNSNNLMLAKLAIAYYIARADGELSDEERNEIGKLTNQTLQTNNNNTALLREEVKKMYNTSDQGFVFVQKYLQPVTNGDLVNLLSIAEEVANSNGDVSPEENDALNKLRDYISDRTGKDFTTTEISDSDMFCQSCGAHMDISDGGGMLVCPFCGTTKVISERKLYAELKEYNFGGISVNDDYFDIIEARLSRGQKIDAIKYTVDKLGVSLADAKALVETYENDMDRTKYDAVFRGQGRKVNKQLFLY